MSNITTPSTVTNLPTPVPQRGGSQPNFTSSGNAFIAALPQLITDINAAMQWIKDAADAASALGDDISGEVQTALDNIEAARDNALISLQGVLDQIEDVQVALGDPETEINALRDNLLAEIETAKQDALALIAAECGGGA